MKIVSHDFIQSLSSKAFTSERRRANFNLHETLDDSVQRFFNAMEPDTYVRPHRHDGDEKWELFIVIRGKACAVTFDENGVIQERQILDCHSENIAIEIPARAWHTIVSLEPGTIMFECKRGPYTPVSDKDFASWAPQEGEADVVKFLDWFQTGAIGELPPPKS
ncbi:MAG: WbuC family cupin fold metalloprotein [Gammaproteobacteria bacterium]|nr:WbuC family cupin fold metalloprotein [Gammaproteobacteria bacterium]